MNLINKQRVLEILCEECAYRCKTEEVKLECCFNYQMISELPCADVKPVVRGEWIEIEAARVGTAKQYTCSVCKQPRYMAYAPPNDNFCHECGADMRKE